MAESQNKENLDIYLHEYDKVKDEQIQRIGFRDNMIYVNLVVVGGVASYGISNADKQYVFLLIPWICIVLGWTYLINDEKISALGRYIRLTLEERIRPMTGAPVGELFGWEVAHRSDKHRMQRKIFQLIVDLLTFCAIGLVAVGYFLYILFQLPNPSPFWIGVSILEIIFLIVLGYQIGMYADLRRGR
jgi:hypothetical protein